MVIRLADIFAAAGSHFLAGRVLAAVVVRAYHAIRACRTAELGGHVQRCPNGHIVPPRFVLVDSWGSVPGRRDELTTGNDGLALAGYGTGREANRRLSASREVG